MFSYNIHHCLYRIYLVILLLTTCSIQKESAFDAVKVKEICMLTIPALCMTKPACLLGWSVEFFFDRTEQGN